MAEKSATVEQMLAMMQHAGGKVPPVRADPEPRERRHLIVSVDDHFMEPAHVFEGRLPARFAERAPRVIDGEGGAQFWDYDGELLPVSGTDAVASWDENLPWTGPLRYEQVRRGAWDVTERLRDMDRGGIYASLNFPSMLMGFAGQRFMRMKDHELGHAAMRAYNDWIVEDWCATDPDRLIPCQVTWLPDAELAAAEIRRNAERGFKAVAFTENPEKLGLPSIHSGRWDPLFAACEETGTVINLHIGSSSSTIQPSSDSPLEVLGNLMPVNALISVFDWFYSPIPDRYPKLQIAMSESGIGWVPWALDQIAFRGGKRPGTRPDLGRGTKAGRDPEEVFQEMFWFTSFYDPRGFSSLHLMNADHIMLEVDYPHSDTNWPDTNELVDLVVGDQPAEVVAKVTHRNACALYRHPLPPADFVERFDRAAETAAAGAAP